MRHSIHCRPNPELVYMLSSYQSSDDIDINAILVCLTDFTPFNFLIITIMLFLTSGIDLNSLFKEII